MGSLSIWHWIVVIAVVLLLFGRGKISDLMGDVAQGIKAFKKGMQDDDKTAADKPAEPVKTIDHSAPPVTNIRGGYKEAKRRLHEFATRRLRFTYSSLVTPNSVFDYDMDTRERELKKRQGPLYPGSR